MNAFIDDNPYNDNNRLMVNNGKVDVAFNKPEWKEGLKYFNRLYKEGLLAPESFTQDEKQFRQLANGTDAMRLGAGAGAGPGRFTTIYGQDGRWLDYISIPPLKGPNGLKQAAYNPYPFTSAAPGNFIITSTNKYPEISMRWADLLYSKEGIGSAEGREGKEFTWLNGQDSSKIGMNGKPALWARIKSFNPNDVQNIDWQQGAISVRNRTFWDGENADPEKPDQTLYYRETAKNYEPYKQDIKKIVPLLYYTDQQANEIADLKKTINDYVNEMFIRFATGDQDIDKNWDSYLKNLDNMNLKRYLQIMQEAYEPTKK
jgi:putative aldouronate transport system substrate-binding protein